MAMDYEHARQQAMAYLDAFNRLDLDAAVAGLHEEFTHQSPFADRRPGRHESRLDGKQAHREYLQWLWAQDPPVRHVLDEVFPRPSRVCLPEPPRA